VRNLPEKTRDKTTQSRAKSIVMRFEDTVSCANTSQAKKLLKAELQRLNVPFTKLTARTIGFSDLARCSCVFVTIHGWRPSPVFQAITTFAVEHGFRVDTDWPISG
jgi:hypothetical protein